MIDSDPWNDMEEMVDLVEDFSEVLMLISAIFFLHFLAVDLAGDVEDVMKILEKI